MKRFIALFLTTIIVVYSFAMVAVFASDIKTGELNDNVSWELSNGKLTVYGVGKVEIPQGSYFMPWRKYADEIIQVEIKDGITEIGNAAFAHLVNVYDIPIPNSVTSIGEHTFTNCTNLSSVKLPNNLKYIGKSAFYGCSNLKSVTIPKSITYMGDGVFSDCISLIDVNIENGLKVISPYTFSGCSSLTNIDIPPSVLAIEEYAFYSCYSLQNVMLEGQTQIANNAFERCTSLKSNKPSSESFNTTANTQITVMLNNELLYFDVQPIEIEGRVLVPVRAIFEALGATVNWDGEKNEVKSTKGDITIILYKDDKTMYKNGTPIILDVPAKDVNDRILVPVRAISEAFGCKVDWDDTKSQVIIISNISDIQNTNSSSDKKFSFITLKNYLINNGNLENGNYAVDCYSNNQINYDIVYLPNSNIINLLYDIKIDEKSDATITLTISDVKNNYSAHCKINIKINDELYDILMDATIDASSVCDGYMLSDSSFDVYNANNMCITDLILDINPDLKSSFRDAFSSGIYHMVWSFSNYLSVNAVGISEKDFGFDNLNNEENSVNLDYVTMYSIDGTTIQTLKSEVEAYKNVGWYTEPVQMLYALDGRSQVFKKSEVPSQLTVGWYEYPVVMMYALDGRTLVINRNEITAYENVGWYYGKPVTMYSTDGRTIIVGENRVSEYKNVGWYTSKNEASKYAPPKIESGDFYYGTEIPTYTSFTGRTLFLTDTVKGVTHYVYKYPDDFDDDSIVEESVKYMTKLRTLGFIETSVKENSDIHSISYVFTNWNSVVMVSISFDTFTVTISMNPNL